MPWASGSARGRTGRPRGRVTAHGRAAHSGSETDCGVTRLHGAARDDAAVWRTRRGRRLRDRWKPPGEAFERVRVVVRFQPRCGSGRTTRRPDTPRDFPIVRLEDGAWPAMAEYVTLAVCARIVGGALRRAAKRAALQQRPRVPKRPSESALLGLGVLGPGGSIALRTFDFPLYGWSRSPRNVPGVTTFTGESGLSEMLARSRVLVALLPSTPDTKGCRSDDAGVLRRGTSRERCAGSLVVESDLLDLLDRVIWPRPRSTSSRASRCLPDIASGIIRRSC